MDHPQRPSPIVEGPETGSTSLAKRHHQRNPNILTETGPIALKNDITKAQPDGLGDAEVRQPNATMLKDTRPWKAENRHVQWQGGT